MKMKIVVTGAIGHIGSFVVRDLANQFPAAEIFMIDNMMTQRFPSLFNLPETAQYRFIEADVTATDLRPLFDNANTVIHLAAITDAAGSFDKAAALEQNNYTGTIRVADACAATGANMIALSSTSVYGTQNNLVAEDCSTEELKPQSPYAETKLKEEEYINSLTKQKALKAISCRFGTIYGVSPGMRFHTAVNKFCWQAVMKQPITVWSTAYQQKRPYLDLMDASRAFSFIIHNNLFDGEIYNLLTQNSTVEEIVNTIREFVPELEIKFVDSPIMNQLSYEVSCEKFKNKGFSFGGDLRRAVGQTIGLLQQSNSL